jgi:hypothetical protein
MAIAAANVKLIMIERWVDDLMTGSEKMNLALSIQAIPGNGVNILMAIKKAIVKAIAKGIVKPLEVDDN